MEAALNTKTKTSFKDWFVGIRHHGVCDKSHTDGDRIFRTNGAMIIRSEFKGEEKPDGLTHECQVTKYYDKIDWDWAKRKDYFAIRSKTITNLLTRKEGENEKTSTFLLIESGGPRSITITDDQGKRERVPLVKPWRGGDCKIVLDGVWAMRVASRGDIVRFIPDVLDVEAKDYRVWGVEAGDTQMAVAEIKQDQ